MWVRHRCLNGLGRGAERAEKRHADPLSVVSCDGIQTAIAHSKIRILLLTKNQNNGATRKSILVKFQCDKEEGEDVFTNSYLETFRNTQRSSISSTASFEYAPEGRRPSQVGLLQQVGSAQAPSYWPNGVPPTNQQAYGAAGIPEDDESEVSFDYADFGTQNKEANLPREKRIKRPPQSIGTRYIGGRWSRFEFIMFVVLNIGQILLLVGGILIYAIGIPMFVQGQIQDMLDGKKSNLPTPKIELQQVAVGPFTSTNFPITIAVGMPAIIPLVPISLTIGSIVIDASLPSLPGGSQISTITTTPISLTVSQPININTTVTTGINPDQQAAIKQFIKSGVDLNKTINVEVAVPVKLFFLQIYNPMRLHLHVVPNVLLNSLGNPADLLPPPNPNQNAKLMAQLNYKSADLVSVGPIGAGLNYLAPKFDDSGVSAGVGADYELTLPAYLSTIPSFSGYIGLGGDKRIVQFYAKNISIAPGLQSTRVRVGLSFTESRINLQEAKFVMAQAFEGFQSGKGSLSDLGLSLMGPFEMPGVDFLSNISKDLAINVPTSLLAGMGGSSNSSVIGRLMTNAGLVDVIGKSDFILHVLGLNLNFRVVLPPFLPLPQRGFTLPFNTSIFIANPTSGTEIVHVQVTQIDISRNSNSEIIAKATIDIKPISFSLDSIQQGLRLGQGLLTAGKVPVQARNISLFTPQQPQFQFFSSQLPIPPFINNTLDFCEGCFARAVVAKVITNIEL